MNGFKLATAWEFAQNKVRLSEPEGEISASTSYRFDYLENTPLLVLNNGNFELKGLKLILKGRTAPLAALETIAVSGVEFDLKKKLVTVPEIRLSKGKVAAAVSESGVLDWQTLVVPAKPSQGTTISSPQEQTADNEPWQLKAEAVKIENVGGGLSGQQPRQPPGFCHWRL